MKRIFIFSIIFLAFFTIGVNAQVQKLVILYTNDVHGNMLLSRDYFVPGEPKQVLGGSARLAAYIKNVRQSMKDSAVDVLLLDGGDIFHGTPEGNRYKGKAMIDIMNTLQYDAMAVGNHEYAYGEKNLKELAKLAEFPFLSCNIIDKKTQRTSEYVKPYIIKKFDNLTVGIIGVTTPSSSRMNFFEHVKGVEFKDQIKAVLGLIPVLSTQRVDIIVLLSHLGSKSDVIIAKAIPEIDLIIGGHDEVILDPVISVDDNRHRIICQAGARGLRVGRLDISVDTKLNRIVDYKNTIVNLYKDNYKPDEQIDELVQKYHIYEMDESIGYTDATLWKKYDIQSPLGNFVCDSIKDATGADIAIFMNGSLTGELYHGAVTYRDLYSVSYYGNNLVTFDLSGSHVMELIERNLNNGFARFHISGACITYNPRNRKGSRLINVKINSKEIIKNTKYTVVTDSYSAFVRFKNFDLPLSKTLKDTGTTVYDALVSYVKKHSHLTTPVGFRIIEDTSIYKGAKININTADAKTLEILKGIGNKKAQSIIKFREEKGLFKSINQLMQVKGIGPGLFSRIKDNITIDEE